MHYTYVLTISTNQSGPADFKMNVHYILGEGDQGPTIKVTKLVIGSKWYAPDELLSEGQIKAFEIDIMQKLTAQFTKLCEEP